MISLKHQFTYGKREGLYSVVDEKKKADDYNPHVSFYSNMF